MKRTVHALFLALALLAPQLACQSQPAQAGTAKPAIATKPDGGKVSPDGSAVERLEEIDRVALHTAALEHDTAHLRVDVFKSRIQALQGQIQAIQAQIPRLEEADKRAEARLDELKKTILVDKYGFGEHDNVSDLKTGAIVRAKAEVSK